MFGSRTSVTQTLLRRDLGRRHRVRVRLADDRVLAGGLHRRVAGDRQPEHAGQVAGHRNRQLQLLALHELAVGDALAAARTTPSFTDSGSCPRRASSPRDRAAPDRCKPRPCAVRRRRTQNPAENPPSGVRSVSPITTVGDGLEGHVQLLGDDLLVRGVRRGLTEVDLAGAHQDRVVGVDLEPRAGSAASSEFFPAAAARGLSADAPAGEAEADEERAAGLDELTAGERRAVDVDAVVVAVAIAYLAFAMRLDARCTASRIAE